MYRRGDKTGARTGTYEMLGDTEEAGFHFRFNRYIDAFQGVNLED